ncbi:glyoxalase [Rhodococcoides trifolii]|uniref:Glyoxalase n=1 Tax=Rhodococcoides trifolii TaxID=908250 RepID=A0A917G5Y7_9NOCA|nr:VOC family protein [Rhodococcus trifolii]GGG24451.1 glyoxalase [Rhodococcus trifolii]
MTISVRQVVIDCTDTRQLAEFYRQLMGFEYIVGDADLIDPDWLAITAPDGTWRIAFQQVATLPAATWPDGDHPQMMHLDFKVGSGDELDREHQRAMDLGATLLRDERNDPEEPLRIYADPAGHPFCIFVGL